MGVGSNRLRQCGTNLALSLVVVNVGRVTTCCRKPTPAPSLLTVNLLSTSNKCRCVRLWLLFYVTSPLSTGLQNGETLLFLLILSLIWCFGLVVDLWHNLSCLAVGKKLPFGLLVHSCILTVRLTSGILVRATGNVLLCVM